MFFVLDISSQLSLSLENHAIPTRMLSRYMNV